MLKSHERHQHNRQRWLAGGSACSCRHRWQPAAHAGRRQPSARQCLGSSLAVTGSREQLAAGAGHGCRESGGHGSGGACRPSDTPSAPWRLFWTPPGRCLRPSHLLQGPCPHACERLLVGALLLRGGLALVGGHNRGHGARLGELAAQQSNEDGNERHKAAAAAAMRGAAAAGAAGAAHCDAFMLIKLVCGCVGESSVERQLPDLHSKASQGEAKAFRRAAKISQCVRFGVEASSSLVCMQAERSVYAQATAVATARASTAVQQCATAARRGSRPPTAAAAARPPNQPAAPASAATAVDRSAAGRAPALAWLCLV